ncbi:hypothetical protein CCP3SC1AL1_3740001 [Gammaproteobacteria bacterium]
MFSWGNGGILADFEELGEGGHVIFL